MALANQEAQRFNHEYIGTEHILLGLVKEGSGVGANVLKNLDVDIRKVRLEVEKLVKSGPDIVTMGKLPQAPRAKNVIEYAIEEARNLNHRYVGTEHLLLGLLDERDGVAALVLMNLGLRLEEVREEVLNLLGVGAEPDEVEVLLAEGFTSHQLVELETEILRISRLEARAVAERAFDEVSAFRERAEQLRRRRDELRRALRTIPAGVPRLPEPLKGLALAVAAPDAPFVERAGLEEIVTHLKERTPLLVVGPCGSGRSALVRAAAEHMQRSGQARLLMQPDHEGLSEDGVPETDRLERLVDAFRRDPSYTLVLEDLEQYLPSPAASGAFSDAWQVWVMDAIGQSVALMATTTPDGLGALRDAWPGFVGGASVVEVPPIDDAALAEILRQRLATIERTHPVRFDNGVVEQVLRLAAAWGAGAGFAEPGRSLRLIEDAVAHAGAARVAEPVDLGAGGKGVGSEQELSDAASGRRVGSLVDSGNYDDAIAMIEELRARERGARGEVKAVTFGVAELRAFVEEDS